MRDGSTRVCEKPDFSRRVLASDNIVVAKVQVKILDAGEETLGEDMAAQVDFGW